jgi:hypothetical protein
MFASAISSGRAMSAPDQLRLVEAIIGDDVAGFAKFFVSRDAGSTLIYRAACQDACVWLLWEARSLSVPVFALAVRARKVTRFLLEFFELEVDSDWMLGRLPRGMQSSCAQYGNGYLPPRARGS